MPLPLTVSCFSKIQVGFTFLVPAYPGNPGKRAVKWVCVCVLLYVQMFDQTGKFKHQFCLPSRRSNTESPQLPARPYGLCVIDNTGLIAVCDRDGHRVVLVTYDGADAGDLLTSSDGLRYPCDVAVAMSDAGNKLVAVVESSSGLLGNEPHHAVKLFSV